MNLGINDKLHRVSMQMFEGWNPQNYSFAGELFANFINGRDYHPPTGYNFSQLEQERN